MIMVNNIHRLASIEMQKGRADDAAEDANDRRGTNVENHRQYRKKANTKTFRRMLVRWRTFLIDVRYASLKVKWTFFVLCRENLNQVIKNETTETALQQRFFIASKKYQTIGYFR